MASYTVLHQRRKRFGFACLLLCSNSLRGKILGVAVLYYLDVLLNHIQMVMDPSNISQIIRYNCPSSPQKRQLHIPIPISAHAPVLGKYCAKEDMTSGAQIVH